MGIISAGRTDIGLKRSTNQDSITMNGKLHLYAVADGMGGHNGGDIASQLAVKVMPEFIEENKDLATEELLKNMIQHANAKIHDKGQSNIELKGMGTTIVALYFKEDSIYIANVGDSRAYLVHNKQIYQITRDHSLVQEKVNMGIYTRSQGQKDKMKNVLTKTVGFDPEIKADVFKFKVSKNDIFLICSDGLHGKVSDRDIVKILNDMIQLDGNLKASQLDEVTQRLVELACANGGQDNISVILSVAQ